MAKDRVITTWGPHALATLTGTTAAAETATAWHHLGPALANRMYFKARFTSAGVIKTSAGNRLTVRGALAPTSGDISTAHTTTLVTRTSTNQATQLASTVALMFNFLRVESTALVSGIAADCFVSAIP